MKKLIECATQAEVDAATRDGNIAVVRKGLFVAWGSATVRASGSATVRAWDSATVEASGSATVRAWGSATVRAWGSATVEASGSATVEAWGSATVRASGSATVRASGSATVEASGSATVRASGSATVEAWGSATVRASGSATVRAWGSATVEAWGSATVRAWGSATVRASGSATVEAWDSATVRASGSATVEASGSATVEATPYVAIHVASKRANITGGVQIVVPDLTVPANWCAYNGLTNDAGLTVVYKALDDDWRGQRKTDVTYEPGSMPEAPDWDPDPTRECGGGLHACASPRIAKREYHPTATRFVAIPVGLDDMVLVGERPNKVRFRNAAGPIVEVDIDGKPVAS